jgi:hypothetical protein
VLGQTRQPVAASNKEAIAASSGDDGTNHPANVIDDTEGTA